MSVVQQTHELAAGLAARPRTQHRHNPHRWLWWNVAAILAVAALLRVWRLGSLPGLNGDEAWAAVQAVRWLRGQDVQWTTPNGNPINPFLFGPLACLHTIAEPSVIVLRSVSLASGLLALVVNFVLCRRAFDARAAWISTVALAVLPIDMAYSRFAWDASQSLLAVLPVLYLPLIALRAGDRSHALAWSVLALAAAILVHPTNVFASLLLVAPLTVRYRSELLDFGWRRRLPARPRTLALLALVSLAVSYLAWLAVSRAALPTAVPAGFASFLAGYVRLFSGTTVYEFICGLNPDEPDSFRYVALGGDLALVCVALGGLLGMIERIKHTRDECDMAALAGGGAMLIAFFVVAGSWALEPHRERYGMCLIAPAVLVVSLGLEWWIRRLDQCRLSLSAAICFYAWSVLALFYVSYFVLSQTATARQHPTFRTNNEEPKLAALREILRQRENDEPITIVCLDYWNYWPAAYFALGERNVTVERLGGWSPEKNQAVRWAAKTWFVGFEGGDEQRELSAQLEQQGIQPAVFMLYDAAERALIEVLGPVEKSFQNY